MARHRDIHYNEDDVAQSIDGAYTTHAEFLADRTSNQCDYWVFFGIQAGRQTGAGAITTVLYSTDTFYYYEHTQDCVTLSYMSFAFMYEIETDFVGSEMGRQFEIYSGGTT